jgi:hypothetical protein
MGKSQGEIFGVALLFVLIILGILFYSQFASLRSDATADLLIEKQYEILSRGSIDAIMEQSTGCYISRGKDSVSDLLKFCLESSYSGRDPIFNCIEGETIFACEYSISLINQSLINLYGEDNSIIGEIPYSFRIEVPRNPSSLLNLELSTNKYRGEKINIGNKEYLRYNMREVSSGVYPLASAQGFVEFELNLYYR